MNLFVKYTWTHMDSSSLLFSDCESIESSIESSIDTDVFYLVAIMFFFVIVLVVIFSADKTK